MFYSFVPALDPKSVSFGRELERQWKISMTYEFLGCPTEPLDVWQSTVSPVPLIIKPDGLTTYKFRAADI